MKINRLGTLILVIVLSMYGMQQQAFAQAERKQLNMEKIYVLGEYQEQYETLAQHYPKTLIEVAGYDMNVAYEIWMDLLAQLEKHAARVNLKLDGVQLHLSVYWTAEGKIDYIGFYPKSESRLISGAEIQALLKTFLDFYKSPVEFDENYNHNASAIFPLSILQERQ